MPRVTVCLPCLNGVRFLGQRLETILAQTFAGWELVVVDSHSSDGSWELLQQHANREPRVRLFQTPREGIYAGINACIREARGEFVYIATSDDTMVADCLATLVDAIERHPDCEVAASALMCIDENGTEIPNPLEEQWLQECFGNLLESEHVRCRPSVGVLHATGRSVNVSLTQLLVRRRLFDRIGLFRTDLGSVADFEWNMRVGLLANTVYVPRKLATWRRHGAQATGRKITSEFWRIQNTMIAQAVCAALTIDANALPAGLSVRRLQTMTEYRRLAWATLEVGSRSRRWAAVLRALPCRPDVVARLVWTRLTSPDWRYPDDVGWVRRLCERAGPTPWCRVSQP